MRQNVLFRAFTAVLVLAAVASGSGCRELGRLAGIEKSTKTTEQTTGELNQNTKDVKDSMTQVNGNTAAMRRQLDDAKKKLDDANQRLDATNAKLEATNARLETLSKSMADTTDNTNALVSNSSDTYVDLRQGDTLAARARHLEGIARAPTQEAKIAEAWKYFAAFEFQFWTARGGDTPARRGELFYEATNEFLHDAERWIQADIAHSASPLSENATMKNVYALATAMDAYNNLQKETLARVGGFAPTNMLDLLHEGLLAGSDLAAGRRTLASLSRSEYAVLEKEDVARYLLAVRQNFLPAIPLAAFTEVEHGGFARLGWLLRLGFSRWNARLDSLNNVELLSLCGWLEKSLSERTFLRDKAPSVLGASVGTYDPQLRLAYANMNVTDSAPGAPGFLAERATLRETFAATAALVAREH